jgi:hypothetical protein
MYSLKLTKPLNIDPNCSEVRGFLYLKDYPEDKKVKFFDTKNKKVLVFLTNNFELSAQDIALRKQRW